MELDRTRPMDVVLLGRVAMDINPEDFSRSFSENTKFLKFVGGSTANTSVGLAKLGCKTGFIGRVSADSLGDYVTNYLKDRGVDVSQIRRCENGELLGLAFTEIRPDGSTNLMMYRNDDVADLKLTTEDISREYIAQAKMLVLSGTALSGEPSRTAALKCLMLAKESQTKIVFDVDYRPQTWKSKDEIAVYYSLAASYADVILGSREEFDLMDSIVVSGENDEQTAERWFAKGVELLIIKHGKEGSYAYAKGKKPYKVLPYMVKSLKATGGGDAYASAFLSGMIKGLPLEKCLERGTASASLAVSATNCSDALPDEEQLNAFIEQRHAKGERVIL